MFDCLAHGTLIWRFFFCGAKLWISAECKRENLRGKFNEVRNIAALGRAKQHFAQTAQFKVSCCASFIALLRQSSLLTWTILVHLYENYWNWNIAQLSDDSLSHFSFAMCAMSRVCTNKRRSSAKDIKVRPLNGIGCDLKAGHAECKFHAFVDPSSRIDFATEWIAKDSQTLRLLVWFICAILHAIVDGEKKWKKIHKRNAELREIRAASDAKLPR